MTRVHALLPHPAPDVDLHEWYAEGWLDGGGIRANFVSSVDGGATAGGLSKGLQTPGDNRVFAVLRDLADVVLVGAGTARDEGYRPVRLSEARLAVRSRYGLAAALPVAVITNSARLQRCAALFAADAPTRSIVITSGAADPEAVAALGDAAEVIVAGESAVDLAAARRALAERGLSRVLCEGGPTLFGELAADGLVDELCLSVTPLLAGPAGRRITDGAPWTGPRPLTVAGLLEEDGALFARYRLG